MPTLKKIWNKIQSFSVSEYYVYFVGLLVLALWALKWVIPALIILVLLAAFQLIFARDGKPALATVVLFIFSLGDLSKIVSPAFYRTAAYIMFPVIVAAFLYRLIRVLLEKEFTLGNLFWGMAIAAVVTMLGGIGYAPFSIKHVGIVFGMCLAGFGFYLLFVNTIRENFVKYAAKLLLCAGMLVFLELVILYIRTPQAINMKSLIDLGWGISNNIAGILAMAIPLTLYLAIDSKHNYCYIVLAFLLYVGVFLTFSRGNILFVSLLMLPMLVYVFCRAKRKFGVLIPVVGVAIAALICFITMYDKIMLVLEKILEKGFDGSGREAIYVRAIKEFYKWPIFGTGVFGNQWEAGSYNMYHCTILQILVNFGVVGLLGYVLFFYQRYAAFFRSCSAFKIMAFCAVLLNELYGLMDINFYSIYHTFFVLMLCIAAEKEPGGDREPVIVKREKTAVKSLTTSS